MTTERVYDIKVNGADSMNELKSAVSELTEKLKSLDQTSKEYLETLKQLTDYQQKLADAMGGISDSAEKTDNSLNGIKETVDSVADSISSLGEDVINSFAEGLAQGMEEAATETAQMGESMDNGVNSVKGLKQEISDLRDKLVTLDKGTDEYKETVQQLINDQVKLKEVMNAGKNETQAAEGSYNALTQRMSALKQVWKETTDEATRNEIGQQINEINNQLKALDASIGNSQRNVGNYKSALEGLDESFVGWKEELKQCKEALQQLDPSTQAYADTMARAAELTHNISEQQEMLKNASTDVGDVLTNVQGVGTNLAAGFSALNAAMGLFGEENEEVQQAMLKVQQAMALVQGMQGMDGFFKNTKKLSTQLGLATKETQANTVATKANATASKQDAQSKIMETTATEGTTVAQKGLNAAMKANPIGFIIGAIATVVTLFTLFKDKIMELIGANDEMSAAFDKVKAVLAGVGNVIKKSVINPIKMAIIPIKTLAKVMIDLFKGDWSKIGDDIKEGFTEMKDNVVDTINVVGAFKEGYDKKVAEQNEAARKAEAAAREKELDNIIKDNEAKYGSDWKYTDEAKKLYDEMFKMRLAQYSQDSDEYREAQRDKLAYDREFNERQKEATDKANEEEKKKQEQAAKEAAQRRNKMLSDFKSAFGSIVPQWTKVTIDITDLYKKWINGAVLFRNELIKTYGFASDMAESITNEMYQNFQKKVLGDIAKIMTDEYEKTFYNMDRVVSSWLSEEKTRFENEKLTLGIELPEDALRHFNDIFEKQSANIRAELKIVNDDISKFYNNAIESNADYAGYTIEQLAKEIPEFQKMLDKKAELEGKFNQVRIDNFKATSEIISKEYEKEEAKDNTYYSNRLKSAELWYNQEEALAEKRQQWFMGDNVIESLNRQEEYENNYYNTTMEMYQKLRDRYIEMSNDQRLTAEERENAEREAARITGQMIEEEMNHQTKLLNNQKSKIKEWQNAIKDAASNINSILSSIGDYWSSMIDLEKTAIQTELENGDIREDEAKRREEANKAEFEKYKRFQATITLINTIAGAIGAFLQTSESYPAPWGQILGGVAAASVAAAGAVEIAKINSTQYGSSSSSSSSVGGSTNFQLPNVMELEPNMGRNTTGMNDTDSLNNIGGNGRGETAIRTYVVESDITASQELANKRSQEVTF
jgi:methyl-accepting chemotaxis protein